MSLLSLSGALLLALSPCAAPGSGAAPAHPNSFSMSEVHVRGDAVRVELRVQVLSLGEVLPGFDDDLDGHAEDGEIGAHAQEIVEYVTAHYRLAAGPATDDGVIDLEERLPLVSSRVTEGPLALDPMNEVSEWVDVVLEYDAGEPGFTRLGVFVDLFERTSPGHADSAAVVWNGIELGAWRFTAGANGHVFEATPEILARNAPALERFLRAAVRDALGAWDVLVLLALLVVGARAPRRSPLVSGVLLAAAFGAGVAFTHRVPERFNVEGFASLTVPLALAYLALDDLLHREGRTRLLEPVVFGLVAGGRVALGLAPAVGTEAAQDEARLGAALGHGAVLLAVTLALTAALPLLARDGERPAFAPRPLRVALAIPALALGVVAFLRGL